MNELEIKSRNIVIVCVIVFNYILTVIDRFSNDCRKTKTKAITPTNHKRNKQLDEPITIPSNYLQLARNAGKISRRWCDCFWF